MGERQNSISSAVVAPVPRFWLTGLLIVLASALIALVAVRNVSPAGLSENYLSDLRIAQFSQPRQASRDIAVVLIDETSLQNLPYRSPLDRGLLASLLTDIERHNPRAIGLNIIFERSTEPDKDRLLYQRLREIEVPLVVSGAFDVAGFRPEQQAYSRWFLDGLNASLSIIYRDSVDQIVRNAMLEVLDGGVGRPGFAAALARSLGVGLPQEARIRIDYHVTGSDEAPFQIYLAHELSDLAHGALQNRVVLVGAKLDGGTQLRTPLYLQDMAYGGYMSGVEVEAHILSQLLQERRFVAASFAEEVYLVLLMALAGCVVALLNLGLRSKLVLAFLLLVLAGVSGISVYFFHGLMLPMVAPGFAFVVALVTGSVWQWRREYRKREQIHAAFGQYLAPNVVSQIVEDPSALTLQGEAREISLVTTDMEGFTRLTETSKPEVMVKLLNGYLDEACEIIIRHGGTIDKIVGDALHVMFNAPVLQQDHASRAVACAIELDRWAMDFKAKRNAEGIALGVTRIGVNTGTVVIGNFGGRKRFDYTAHGDAVNVTARLESINKMLGTTVCVSESTMERCPDAEFRPVARLVLYGKEQGVRVYSPVNPERDPRDLVDEYRQAYQLMEQESEDAVKAFEDLARRFPDDRLVALHSARLAKGDSGETIVCSEK